MEEDEEERDITNGQGGDDRNGKINDSSSRDDSEEERKNAFIEASGKCDSDKASGVEIATGDLSIQIIISI